VAIEFAHRKPVFECLGEWIVGVGERAKAFAQVPDSRNVEQCAQSSRRSAIVSNRDDPRHIIRETSQCTK
jgi:hypothetical protein